MANYIIIGGDGKEYGPVTTNDVRQWLAESRLNAQSLVKAESDAEFRPLEKFPEFADAFAAHTPGIITPLKASADFLERDYELDLVGCITNGWELVKNNMNRLFVATLFYLLIEMAIGGLSNIPFVGTIFSIGNFVIAGPLMGGLFYLFIRVNRKEPAQVGDMFAGFRRLFGQLFLGTFVQGLLVGACLIPFLIILLVKLFPILPQISQFSHLQPGAVPDKEMVNALVSALLTGLPVGLLCAIPATYLGVCWKFTLPLIIDKQMNFWTAMKTSWKMVNKHWWQIFGLVILISLLNVAGLCACCVGLLFTIPIGIAALMIAYETIFGVQKN
jgi:uncharacterized membrane protein